MRLNAKQLRDLEVEHDIKPVKRFPVTLILDNVYDTYNIGGLFRLSDALSIEKLYICGGSEIPPNIKIKRASIGTYKIVLWEYRKTAVEAIEEVRRSLINGEKYGVELDNNLKIVAIEQAENSIPYQNFSYSAPIVFVVGNETSGCQKETLASCDAVVEIPMHGINLSLNVIVSASIVMYHAYNEMKLL